MDPSDAPRVVCLSNIFDQHYHERREESVARCLTVPFRRDLFQCLELATGREVVVLSSPPRAQKRRGGKWLAALETRFSTHRQYFCCNWDAPKLRIPLSWFFYARHVLRHVRDGDLVVVDNYEFIYIVAAWLVRWFRKVRFGLVYLDGKHIIDRSWSRFLSGLAEVLGRPLFCCALLSNPLLKQRLAPGLPVELVPGFVPAALPVNPPPHETPVRFVYSGLLARSHGIDLLLAAIPMLPPQGWSLVIAGQGALAEEVKRFVAAPQWKERVAYLPPMPSADFQKLLAASDVGLNCQRLSAPISSVTFPSKIFTYLSAGLLVLSSRSGCVEAVCQDACLYYPEETPEALAAAMSAIIADFAGARQKTNPACVSDNYSLPAAAHRLNKLVKLSKAIH